MAWSEQLKVKNVCKFANTCKRCGTDKCCCNCFPFVLLHGSDGKGGIWKARNVPKKYDNCFLDNLPIEEENPKAYDVATRFIYGKNGIVKNVENGLGFFFVGQATRENPIGCGTGKTQTAITILNHYTIEIVRAYLKHEVVLEDNPSLFYNMAEFQSLYNSQFKGSFESQEKATNHYNRVKELMCKTNLLVMDDIAIRGLTENFENEFYCIINHRAIEGLSTIFTSNIGVEELRGIIGERIVSRIQGMTMQVVFEGIDHRKIDF